MTLTAAPRRTSYPMVVVRRARELRAGEWTPTEIRRLLQREFDCSPTVTTIKRWTDPAYEKHQAELMTRKNRARALRARDAKLRELFHRRVGLRAIGQVSAVLWGEELTVAQVRERLGLKQGVRAARGAA